MHTLTYRGRTCDGSILTCLITDGRIFEGKRLGKHVLPCVVPQYPTLETDGQSIWGETLNNAPTAGTTSTTGHRQFDF